MSVGLHKETVCRVVTLNKFTVLSTDNSYLMKCIHTVHFFLHYAIRVNTFRTISFYKPGFFQFNLEIMTCSYTKFTVLSTDNSYLMKCIHTVHFFLHYAISVNTFRTISFYKPGFFQFNLEIMTCSYTNRVCTGRYLWFFFSNFLYTDIFNKSRFRYNLTILLLNCQCSLSTTSSSFRIRMGLLYIEVDFAN